jgi:hypothetical protein
MDSAAREPASTVRTAFAVLFVPENRHTRNPWFLLRFLEFLVLRYAARQFLAELFQLPPRTTR